MRDRKKKSINKLKINKFDEKEINIHRTSSAIYRKQVKPVEQVKSWRGNMSKHPQ